MNDLPRHKLIYLTLPLTPIETTLPVANHWVVTFPQLPLDDEIGTATM